MADSVKSQKTLQEALDALTIEGVLVVPQPGGKVRCLACGHQCLIFPGQRGICQVRFNQAGVLRVATPEAFAEALAFILN